MKNGGLTAELVEVKLREFNGNMAAVGRHFGVTRQAVWDFCRKRKALAAVAADCRETMKDHAESALQRAVIAGEAWAVCFYLKCQAKDRGYVEKSEIEVAGSVKLQLVEEIIDAAGSASPGQQDDPPASEAGGVSP